MNSVKSNSVCTHRDFVNPSVAMKENQYQCGLCEEVNQQAPQKTITISGKYVYRW